MKPSVPLASLYEGVDDTTCALALCLQMEDIDGLLNLPSKGAKRNEAGLTEWQQTLMIQKAELQRNLSVIRDRQLTHGLAYTVLRESPLQFHTA